MYVFVNLNATPSGFSYDFWPMHVYTQAFRKFIALYRTRTAHICLISALFHFNQTMEYFPISSSFYLSSFYIYK